MKKQPPWKAENARIRKELTSRKNQSALACNVVQIPARTAKLNASWTFNEAAALFIPEGMRKDMARQVVAHQMVEELQHEFINMTCHVNEYTGTETWTGSLWAVRGEKNE